MHKQTFIIDGIRTPFMRSLGAYTALMSVDLGTYVVNGLSEKTTISKADIDYVCMGTVLSDPNTTNVAREIVLASLLHKTTPAHTVTMACISSNCATTTLVDMIESRKISCGIAGGVETFSDLPIRFSKALRQRMLEAKRKRSLFDHIKLWSGLRLRDLKPEVPSPKEFSTGFTMGEAGDQLAAAFHIDRHDADAFALLSHQRAVNAWRSGYYTGNVLSIDIPPQFTAVTQDDGPRSDTSLEKLATLAPSFDRFGINTAGNSSPFTDGASAILLGTNEFCKKHGYSPLAQIKDFLYAAGDPANELLLGPALTVPLLLSKHSLTVNDIDVWEIHEAFAGQVLANLKAMASSEFCKNRLGLNNALGEVPLERVNLWGGSLSLGHPFGATGTRLIHTAALRLVAEDGKYAVVTGCAASGLGSAILLERT